MVLKVKRLVSVIVGITGVLVFVNIGMSQDLQTSWAQYLQTENRYQTVKLKEQDFLNQQQQLLEKQQHLQEKQSWFNGWIVKMQLAGVSEDLLEIADSLEIVRNQLSNLEIAKSSRFQAFKREYLAMMQGNNKIDELSADWTNQSNVIIQSIEDNSDRSGVLPDYSAIVNKLYDDNRTRDLVLKDLQKVIRQKISYIDSLKATRQSDLALLRSMAEFRKDVQLQTQSEADVSHTSPAELEHITQIHGASTQEVYSDQQSNKVQRETPGRQEIIVQTSREISGSENIIQSDIKQLEKQRVQYQQLLETIEKELQH